MGQVAPVNIQLVFKPLAGGGTTTYTQDAFTKNPRIKRCSVHLTQSVGDQTANLVLDNVGGPFDAWTSAAIVGVYVQRPRDTSYQLLVEGFVQEPLHEPGARPQRSFSLVGLNSVLDLISLSADVSFAAGSTYTTAFDTLCSTYLSGYTRTITSDASTMATATTFLKGTKLREALDFLRRALLAATGSKWEYTVTSTGSGATKTITLFKRGTSSQATYSWSDALEGTKLSLGSAWDVVNRAIVNGATVPSKTTDESGLTHVGYSRIDSNLKYVAQPFVAVDTPLYSHAVWMDRSSGKDPPTLSGVVVRNSDNIDRLGRGIGSRATLLRSDAGWSTPGNMIDGNTSTNSSGAYTSVTDKELVVYDLGVGVSESLAVVTHVETAVNALITFKIWGSTDDSSYTSLCSWTSSTTITATVPAGAPVGPYRYYKLTVTTTGPLSPGIKELHLHAYDNSTASTNPRNLLMDWDGGGVTTVTTAFGTTTEIARFDLRSAQPVVKLVVKHTEGSANGSVTVRWQRSSDASTWFDVSISASTTSNVVDNFYLDEADFRYLRLVAQDDRTSGAGILVSVDYVQAYYQTASWGSPLAGDAMRGSSWSWSVSNLVSHPALVEATTFPAPRLALQLNRLYWCVYNASGAIATSYWDMDYGTDSGGPTAAVASADGGVTWAAIAANAQLRHVTAFNNHQLTSQQDDASSQATYANFVPNGILVASLTDLALVTQDMVDAEAKQLIKARPSTQKKGVLVVPLNPALTVGNPVTLDASFGFPYGSTTGDLDVVEVVHDLVGGAGQRTALFLNDHPGGDAVARLAALSTKRTV